MQLTDREFQLISSLVYKSCGIKLGEQKRSLVAMRLQKALMSGGFGSFQEYYDHIIRDTSGRALLDLVDRISTNHTYFFREQDHFDFLVKVVLPGISKEQRKNNRPKIRIWSAGCSSGEEPYTLAMVVNEHLGDDLAGVDVGILATDISVSALEKAKAGVYPAEKMLQVPYAYRLRYFNPLSDGSWEVKKLLKDMVLFRRLNLVSQRFQFKGLFHVIFCRNVLIYFDRATQNELIARFHRYTEAGGYLFIGHSETLDRGSGLYQFIKPSVYRKI